ncbi:DUF2759 family protein [Bacillus horti]|uniref:Membrane protein n=1 Tax=Caldalkalibacillus horti TaxID=77523 RepID=A0ABT9W3K3_9BACI|nr:DUF2759 family protein [Bacillus horti]MDQ0167827.1 putative membrane protein [Bacillus horti]
MIFIIVTFLIALLSLFGLLRSLKEKNLLAAGFSFVSFAIFGWFSFMETFFSS